MAAMIAAIALTVVDAPQASAQYYQIANQISGLISPALSGSLRYKGFVEADGLAGFGDNRANFIGVSTSQGFKYADWFFMGVGLGVDVAMAEGTQPDFSNPPSGYDNYGYYNKMDRTKVMIPIFTDFRFNIGSGSGISAFIDLKLGAAWLLGNGYLKMQNGYMNNGTQFMLRPTVGVRIPVNKNKPKQAVNIGVTYQLLTANDNYLYWNRNQSVTLNNLGVTVGFEW